METDVDTETGETLGLALSARRHHPKIQSHCTKEKKYINIFNNAPFDITRNCGHKEDAYLGTNYMCRQILVLRTVA